MRTIPGWLKGNMSKPRDLEWDRPHILDRRLLRYDEELPGAKATTTVVSTWFVWLCWFTLLFIVIYIFLLLMADYLGIDLRAVIVIATINAFGGSLLLARTMRH